MSVTGRRFSTADMFKLTLLKRAIESLDNEPQTGAESVALTSMLVEIEAALEAPRRRSRISRRKRRADKVLPPMMRRRRNAYGSGANVSVST
jgi:hypothetical protein